MRLADGECLWMHLRIQIGSLCANSDALGTPELSLRRGAGRLAWQKTR